MGAQPGGSSAELPWGLTQRTVAHHLVLWHTHFRLMSQSSAVS